MTYSPEDHAAAKTLLLTRGAQDARSYLTAQAIERHLDGNEAGRAAAVRTQLALAELTGTKPPATSALDVYRTAQVLLGQRGLEDARRFAVYRQMQLPADPADLAVWVRIAESIEKLARRENCEGETEQ